MNRIIIGLPKGAKASRRLIRKGAFKIATPRTSPTRTVPARRIKLSTITAGGRSGVGRLQKAKAAMTRDNRITNRLVRR